MGKGSSSQVVSANTEPVVTPAVARSIAHVTNRSDLPVTKLKLKLHKHCAFITIMLIYCQTVTKWSDLSVSKRREYGEFQ